MKYMEKDIMLAQLKDSAQYYLKISELFEQLERYSGNNYLHNC